MMEVATSFEELRWSGPTQAGPPGPDETQKSLAERYLLGFAEQLATFASDTPIRRGITDCALAKHAHHLRSDAMPPELLVPSYPHARHRTRQNRSGMRLG